MVLLFTVGGIPPYMPTAEEEAAAKRKVSSVDN